MSTTVSETSKHRALVIGYCHGNGLDLGSAGDPIKPEAIQVEREDHYCPYFDQKHPPQLMGDASNLVWFRDGVLDFVYSSHLIEDYSSDEQRTVIREWCRVIKKGGHLVILAPEKERWALALFKGQPPNLAHKHEPSIGELTGIINGIGGWQVLEDRFCDGDDYSLFFVARKF
jgi:predicted SAM-dependent methyltransferase